MKSFPGGKISVLVLASGSTIVLAAFVAIAASTDTAWIRFFDNVHWTASYATAAVLGWIGALRADSENERIVRRWFAIGLSFYTLGQILWDVQIAIDWNPFPGPSDLFYLMLGPCFAIGFYQTLKHSRAAQVRAALLDTAALSAVVLAATLALYLPRRGETPAFSLAVMALYPVLMLSSVCLAGILIPTLRLRYSLQWAVFFSSSLVNGALWMRWNSLTLDNALDDGTILNGAFSVTAILMGVGALLWKPVSSFDPRHDRSSEAVLRILPLFLVIAASTGAALTATLPGQSEMVQITTGGAALLVVLIAAIRQSMLLADRDKLFETREALRETENTFLSLFEGAYDAVLILDDKAFIECNKRAEEVFGRPRAEIIGRSPVDFSPPLQADDVTSEDMARDKIARVLAGDPQRFEWIHIRPDNTRFSAEVALKRIDRPGRPRLLAIVRDMSAWKNSEKERDRLIDELEEKNAELERFTYTVSHDLKSPLVTIQSFAGFIRTDLEEKAYGKIASDLSFIQKAATKMDALLHELLELSRIGRKVNPPEDCDLDRIVSYAADIVAGRVAKAGANVILGPIDLVLRGDKSRLVEVFQNLIDNALKFMGDQPSPEVRVGRESRNGRETVYVRDNGEGIDPRFHHKLFGLFEKLHPEAEGTGMGLAIVKRIVELHGGQITVESDGRPGLGTTFYLHFPGAASTRPDYRENQLS